MMNKVTLKKDKEKAIKNRHHWIFSGAVAETPSYEDGAIMPVYSSAGEWLGSGYFNSKAKIVGRMLTFDATPPETAIRSSITESIACRRQWFNDSVTNAYRLVNGEGDRLPGLIVDRYADCLVIQISTLGMEKLKALIVEILVRELSLRAVLEKSNLPSRKEEGLGDSQSMLYGESVDEVEILENGLKFIVSLATGQKTGFFLDHREMRNRIRQLAKGKKVLNAFSYTGGFSVAALAGGAEKVDSVDISKPAVEFARRNVELNGFRAAANGFFADDVFQYLRSKELDYDIVILDPPAFAKRKKDIVQACRGYKDINRVAMKKMPKGSLLLTCSCSYYVDEALFQKVVFQAAVEAGRFVRIIGRHALAPDHPVNICHPEGDYLKSLLLYID